MLKLLRTLKIDKSSTEKDDSNRNSAAATDTASAITSPSMPGWQQFSSRLMGRLSSATQTPMPQMPGAAPAPEIHHEKN